MGKNFWSDLRKLGIALGVAASIITILRGLDGGSGAGVGTRR